MAFQAGRKLASPARPTTIASQNSTPCVEKVKLNRNNVALGEKRERERGFDQLRNHESVVLKVNIQLQKSHCRQTVTRRRRVVLGFLVACDQNLVVGRFAMCQEAGRRMLAQGRGSIMNIGSLASTTALGRGHIAYSIAMGAVVQMTRELSTEWSHRGVRVNCVTPAQVINPSLAARMEQDPTLEGRFLKGIPAGRLGQPTDIMGLAVLLASDASEWITGAIIPMDGGNMAMNAGGTPGHEQRVVQTFRAEGK